jgi:hypothetical protein
MKLTLIVSLLLSASSFAQCLGNFCVGSYVIDSSNKVGIVKAIGEDIVIYRRNGYSSNSESRPSQLAYQKDLENYEVNKYVIDSSNKVGKIKLTFSDGRVLYRRNGYSSDSVSKNLSYETILENFPVGKYVIDSSNKIGKVKLTFSDGRILYRRNGYSSDSVTKKLSYENPIENFAKGTIVIDSSSKIGKVKLTFSDGRILYRRNGYSSDSISKDLEYEKAIAELPYGKLVMDSSNKVGNVKLTFSDGRVVYRRNGYSSNSISKELYPEIESIKKIKKDVVVIDPSNRVGVVKHVFSHGKIVYRRDGYSSNSIETKLYVEVAKHPEYKKDILYSSDNYKIGKVKRFFENGKIQLVGNAYNFIAEKLFGEADEFSGLTIGDEVLIFTGENVAIETLFANGAFQYSYDYDEKKVVVNSRILVSERDMEYGANKWVVNLSMYLSTPPTNRHQIKSAQEAINPEQYEEFKKKLIEVTETNSWLSKKEKKALINYLNGEDDSDDDVVTPPEDVPETSIVYTNKKKYINFISTLFLSKDIPLTIIKKDEFEERAESGEVVDFNIEVKKFPIFKTCKVRLFYPGGIIIRKSNIRKDGLNSCESAIVYALERYLER